MQWIEIPIMGGASMELLMPPKTIPIMERTAAARAG
jgi:hypothetical protein